MHLHKRYLPAGGIGMVEGRGKGGYPGGKGGKCERTLAGRNAWKRRQNIPFLAPIIGAPPRPSGMSCTPR